MNFFLLFIILLIFCERIVKHWLVIRFFRRVSPQEKKTARLVSILQPILSGDPTLSAGLELNLRMKTGYALEYLWLVDEDDLEAQSICHTLIERFPEKHIRLMLLPPPDSWQNPKMVKLIAGAQQANGNVLCMLDDDTRLPDYGLEVCIPYLDQPKVGLAFGLPYYISFDNFWSRLVAYFVNSHSLINYVPYSSLTQPVTINGMFYAIRRSIFEKVDGFNGLENTLADDFAIAQRIRSHKYLLAQTALRHSISTWVSSPSNFFNLLQRWLIFPRESMMRHLKGRDLITFYGIAVIPVFFPWLALAISIISPSLWLVTLAYFIYCYIVFAHLNIKYLNAASPWKHSYLVILISLLLPLQILVALIAPQRIIWRGHVILVEPGGNLTILRRRKQSD